MSIEITFFSYQETSTLLDFDFTELHTGTRMAGPPEDG